MSIKIMSDIWGMDLPGSQMLVLLALADCANDEGVAWPSIATVSWKCRKSRRTVQEMISDLADAGHLTREEVPGVGCRYQLHPRKDCTPAKPAPRQNLHPRKICTPPVQNLRGTRAKSAPNPSLNHHITNSPNPRAGGRKPRFQFPDDWKAPALPDLPPAAQRAASQWPVGAYEGQAEAFALSSKGKGHRAADWDAMWAGWIAQRHEAVMRGSKTGTGYTAPASASAGNTPTPPRPASRPTAAKGKEDERSVALHDALHELIGEHAWERWFSSAALLFADPGLAVVAATETHRERLESEYSGHIDKALSALGWGRDWVRFDVQASRGGKRVA